MHSLPLLFRLTGQPVILLATGEAGEAKRRLLERAGAVLVGEDDPAARLAFIALEEPLAAAQRLRARGVLINVTDRPDLCDFTVPSILERGPVLIAVGTGGVSAGLAKALRMRLEAILPQSLGSLADALGSARVRMRQVWPDSAERRKQIDTALAPGGAIDPLRDLETGQFEAWLDAASGASALSTGARIEFAVEFSDPDQLTLYQARALANADLVVHDPEIAPAILALARADAARALTGGPLPDGQRSLTVIIRQG